MSLSIKSVPLFGHGQTEVSIPAGGEILSVVGHQPAIAMPSVLAVRADWSQPEVKVRVAILSDGEACPDAHEGRYLGSVHILGGSVIHVFVEH